MLASIQETEILKACRTLFGPDVWLDRNFLFYLQPEGAKAAFRQRAKETHPDRFPGEARVQRRQSELFQNINQAYDLVTTFLGKREQGIWPPRASQRPRGPSSPPPQPRPRYREQNSRPGGPLHARAYEIGSYLYSRGVISYPSLIEALVWQRRQRPLIGETAFRWGWLNEPALRRILNHRSTLSRRFGDKAVELGLLTPFQVRTLLFFQRSQHQRLGQFFVEKGILTPEELDRLVKDLQEHNARIPASVRRSARY